MRLTVTAAAQESGTGIPGVLRLRSDGAASGPGGTVDPTLVWNAVRHSWWLLVSGLLIGLALAGTLIWTATPQYSSSTRLFVSVAGADSSAAYQNNLFSQERVTSYAELLSGTQLAGEVVDELHL